MNFIKKIFDKNIDESVHLQFQKFSKGEFRNRALVKAKNIKGKYTIATTNEFANDLVRVVAERLGNSKTDVKGVVVSTADLGKDIEFKGKKQFMGIKQYSIDSKLSGKEIIDMLEKMPKAFFALTFSADGTDLKIKPKAPKSAKPSTKKNKKINPDFCKLITTDKHLAESFVFESKDWKNVEIGHDFMINDLIIPQGEKDFAKIREMAKRKGKIIRNVKIDDKESKSEIDFEA